MAEIFEYKCPSCGANLKISPEESFVKCSFCGTTVQRELDADEQASASAKKLAKKVEKYKNDMHELDRLENKLRSNEKQVEELEKRKSVETTFMRDNPKVVPIIIVVFGLFGLFGASSFSDGLGGLIGCVIVAVIVYFCTLNGKDQAEKDAAEAYRKLDGAKEQLEITRGNYESLKKRFDPDVIPAQYRNDAALDYVIVLFKTEQSSNLGDAFKRYEDHVHQEKMESMQQQQIALQQQQIEKMDQLAAKKSEEDFSKTAAKAGAAVIGTVVAGKVVKEILKRL